jgi:hypothetical protein
MHEFSAEETGAHIVTLGVVARHIDEIIAAGRRTDEDIHTMGVNVKHIRAMCAKPHIVDTGTDLTPYTDAAHRGAAWLA